MTARAKLTDVNAAILCELCGGYLIDAVTVTECMHSFCRSCLWKRLLGENHMQRVRLQHQLQAGIIPDQRLCPHAGCDTRIALTSLNKSVRSDHVLQTLVYKLVPALYREELQRRRDFIMEFSRRKRHMLGPHANNYDLSDELTRLRTRLFDMHIVDLAHRIASPDEKFSICVQHYNGSEASTSAEVKSSTPALAVKRYFRCPAMMPIGTLRKLLMSKLELPPGYSVCINVAGVDSHPIELHSWYTLTDVAYITRWDRKSPMQLQFTVVESDEVTSAVHLNVETHVPTPPASVSALKAQLMMPTQQVNTGSNKPNGLVTSAHVSVNGNAPRQTIINGNTGSIMPLPVGLTRIAPSTSLDQSSKYIDAQMRLNGTAAMLAQQRIANHSEQSSAPRLTHEDEPIRKKQRKAASPMKRPMAHDNTPPPKPTLTSLPAAATSSVAAMRMPLSTTSSSSIFPPTHTIAPATGIPPPLTQGGLTSMHGSAIATNTSTLRQQLEQGKIRQSVPTSMSPIVMQQMAQQMAQQMVHQQSMASMASMMASAYMLQMMPPDMQQSMVQMMMRDQAQQHQQQWQAMQRMHYNRHARPDANVFTNGTPPATHK